MKILAFGVFFFLYAFSTKAQQEEKNPGKITGRIIDSLTSKPMEYATIGLFMQNENKIVNGTTTDNTGVFEITSVKEGAYKMVIEFIGYKKSERNNIVVSKENEDIKIGDIKISGNQTSLQEVTISAEKNIVENKIDKTVYNVEKDVTSQSGVAADVLKKVPQVFVDVDGNVELQGNANIRFLINGKPSILFGSNIADVLQSIPASQIKSIEIITSPGAKYDASGTGGIINIILKKSTVQGGNGNVSISAGTRLENGSLNLNIRKGNFGINVFASGNAQLLSTIINSLDRFSQDTSTSSYLFQNGKSDFNRNGFQSGVGFDWDINPKNNITATIGYDYFANSNIGSANRQTLVQDISGNQISDITDAINTSNKFHEHSIDYDLGYSKKLKKEDQQLEVLFNASSGHVFTYYEQTQKYLSPDEIYNSSYGNNSGIENETNMEVNYTQPLTEDAVIETGVKKELYHINPISDVYVLNTLSNNYDFNSAQSSVADYKRDVNAGYLSATFKLFELLDIKTGIRDEYTTTKANFSDAGTVNVKPYNTIVPSIVISHSFKNKQTLKISYAHRIERPEYRDLNPFVNASDPKNISTGNPNIRPEIGDKVELGYSQTSKKGNTINTTLFYRGNMDDIQFYTRYYPTYNVGDTTYTNVAVSTRENIGREDNFGLSLFASIPVKDKINIRANISCFERFINTGISSVANVHGFNYRTNINVSYQVTSMLIIELFGNFNSPRINAQGTMPAFTTYNFAFRKQLLHKNGSIALTATNFLNEYVNQKTKLTGDNFTLSNTRQLPYRSFGINLTYKFGKLEFKKEKEPEDINLTNPPGIEK
jgi:ferric enterobactin receptor